MNELSRTPKLKMSDLYFERGYYATVAHLGSGGMSGTHKDILISSLLPGLHRAFERHAGGLSVIRAGSSALSLYMHLCSSHPAYAKSLRVLDDLPIAWIEGTPIELHIRPLDEPVTKAELLKQTNNEEGFTLEDVLDTFSLPYASVAREALLRVPKVRSIFVPYGSGQLYFSFLQQVRDLKMSSRVYGTTVSSDKCLGGRKLFSPKRVLGESVFSVSDSSTFKALKVYTANDIDSEPASCVSLAGVYDLMPHRNLGEVLVVHTGHARYDRAKKYE